jgi:hypothetical protein
VRHNIRADAPDFGIKPVNLTEKQIGMAKVKIYNLEILVYNPEEREISGWLVFDQTTKDFIDNLFYETIEFEDIITSKTYK